jgi:hypothetical protein
MAGPRCPAPSCPVRWRGGPDRMCPDHAEDEPARLPEPWRRPGGADGNVDAAMAAIVAESTAHAEAVRQRAEAGWARIRKARSEARRQARTARG